MAEAYGPGLRSDSFPASGWWWWWCGFRQSGRTQRPGREHAPLESVSIEAARAKLCDLVDSAMTGRSVTITRYRRPAAVLASAAWYEQATECLEQAKACTK